MVRYLVSRRADVNKAGASWATPIAWAKRKGHVDIHELLTKAGAL